MAMPVQPVPPRRIVTERRQRPFRAGLGLAVFALLLIAAGAVLTSVSQALTAAEGDKALVGNPIAFDADSGRYAILLVDDPGIDDAGLEALVVDVECEIETSDGAILKVDHGTLRGSDLSTGVGTIVSDFEATSGRTSVTCRWKEGRGGEVLLYAVGRSHDASQLVGIGMIVFGLLLGVAAAALIVIGVRGRQVIQTRVG